MSPQDQEAQAAAGKNCCGYTSPFDPDCNRCRGFVEGAAWQKSREPKKKSFREIREAVQELNKRPPTAEQVASLKAAFSSEEEMAKEWRLKAQPNINELDRDDCFIAGLRKGAEAERDRHRLDAGSWENTALSLDAQLASALAEIERLKAESKHNYDSAEHWKELLIQTQEEKDESEATIASLKAELEEQCRINGMGAQRELRLKTLLGEAENSISEMVAIELRQYGTREAAEKGLHPGAIRNSFLFELLDKLRASSGPKPKEGKDVQAKD